MPTEGSSSSYQGWQQRLEGDCRCTMERQTNSIVVLECKDACGCTIGCETMAHIDGLTEWGRSNQCEPQQRQKRLSSKSKNKKSTSVYNWIHSLLIM